MSRAGRHVAAPPVRRHGPAIDSPSRALLEDPVRRWREPLILLLLFGAFTAWWLWPLPLVWRDHSAFLGERQETPLADFYLVTWVLAWDAHAVLTQPWALFQANAFFPSPSSLAYSEHLLGYLP